MDRRGLLHGAVAATAWCCAGRAWAQPARTLYRIGLLGVGNDPVDMAGPKPRSTTMAALISGLRDLGYTYGEHYVTEPRSAQGQVERFPALAAELIALKVDVIVAAGPALAALKAATSTVPVVMAGAEDPIGIGAVKSLARPGTNFTGLSNQSVEATVKRLELLKEIVPGRAPVAVLWDSGARLTWLAVAHAASQRGWRLTSYEVRDLAGIEAAVKAASAAKAGALLPFGGLAFSHADAIAELALASRLPAGVGSRATVRKAGLISYGADLDAIWRRAAYFVDKIRRGADPATLPVEQPTAFHLAVNLKTAKALGLAIPQSLLLRADEVVE